MNTYGLLCTWRTAERKTQSSLSRPRTINHQTCGLDGFKMRCSPIKLPLFETIPQDGGLSVGSLFAVTMVRWRSCVMVHGGYTGTARGLSEWENSQHLLSNRHLPRNHLRVPCQKNSPFFISLSEPLAPSLKLWILTFICGCLWKHIVAFMMSTMGVTWDKTTNWANRSYWPFILVVLWEIIFIQSIHFGCRDCHSWPLGGNVVVKTSGSCSILISL